MYLPFYSKIRIPHSEIRNRSSSRQETCDVLLGMLALWNPACGGFA
jgi:hypothetical protein